MAKGKGQRPLPSTPGPGGSGNDETGDMQPRSGFEEARH